MSKISFQELRKQPDNTTQCPYERKASLTKTEKMEDIVAKQYFYDVISGPTHAEKRKGDFQERGGKRERREGEQRNFSTPDGLILHLTVACFLQNKNLRPAGFVSALQTLRSILWSASVYR